jgi:pimeloyl-ACP methyl ester carboxylesterase
MLGEADPMAKDLIVVIPGIGGSVLRQRGTTKPLWDTSWFGFTKALLSGRSAFEQLIPPPDDSDDGIEASALIDGVHLIPGFWSYGSYGPLTKRLEEKFGPAQVVQVPYDWRRSNTRSAQHLHATLENALRGYPSDTRVVVVAHSMGGLVARRFLATSPLAERCRMLITIGTPYRGAIKALDALVNGVGIPGPAGHGLTTLLRSLPSVYELLPTYDCLVGPARSRSNLAKDPSLLPDAKMFDSAFRFHAETDAAFADGNAPSPDTIAVVGQRQRTPVLASQADGGIRIFDDDTWTDAHGDSAGTLIRGAGDGTVPRGASQPPEWGQSVAGAQPFSGRHVNLPQLKSVWNAIEGAITGHEFMNLGGEGDAGFGIGLADTVAQGDDLNVTARHPSNDALALDARVLDVATGTTVGSPKRLRNDGDGAYSAAIRGLEPGFYEVAVSGKADGAPRRVSDLVTVFPVS